MGEKAERILWATHPDQLLELAIAWMDRGGRIHDCEHCIDNAARLQSRWDGIIAAVEPPQPSGDTPPRSIVRGLGDAWRTTTSSNAHAAVEPSTSTAGAETPQPETHDGPHECALCGDEWPETEGT